MMITTILFLSLFFISQAFFSFDEESLIILASIFWMDAAGSLIKSLLDAELVHKVDSVESKFSWFLRLKVLVLEDLRLFHESRISLMILLVQFNNIFVSSLLYKNILFALENTEARIYHDSRTTLVSVGQFVYYDRTVRDLQDALALLEYSGTSVNSVSLPAGRLGFLDYTVSNYSHV